MIKYFYNLLRDTRFHDRVAPTPKLIGVLKLDQLLLSKNEDSVLAGLTCCLFFLRNYSYVTREYFSKHKIFDKIMEAEIKFVWKELIEQQ